MRVQAPELCGYRLAHRQGSALSMTACDSSRSKEPTARARRRRHDCSPRICVRSDPMSSRCASRAGPPTGESVRAIVLEGSEPVSARAEALLFAAARAQLVEDIVAPALERGATVIADRYVGSSLVYQGVVRGVGADAVRTINDIGTGGSMPDATVLLDRDRRAGGGAARSHQRRSHRARAARVPPQGHRRLRGRALGQWPPRACGRQRPTPKQIAARVREALGL